jgi:two-component system response regulator HydG
VPPLRERKEDIPLLTTFFIDQQNGKTGKSIRGLSSTAMRLLLDYYWPGNVRELENAVEHAFVLCRGGEIDILDLPVELRQAEYRAGTTQPVTNPGRSHRKRAAIDRDGLLTMLDQYDWNKAEVARQLGVSRTAVWKYMKKWNIPLSQCCI